MSPSSAVRVSVSARQISWVVGVLVLMAIVHIAATYVGHARWARLGWPLSFVGNQLALAGENTVGTWFSSMLLALVALAMVACFVLEPRRAARRGVPDLRYGWLLAAAVFGTLSLDELGSLHERLVILGLPSIAGVTGWVGMLGIPILIVGAFLLAFAWARLRSAPAAMILMALGVLLFLSVPLQEHIEWTQRAAVMGGSAGRNRVLLAAEEGSELLGALCVLGGALLYARRLAWPNGREASPARIPIRLDVIAAGTLLLVVGLLVMQSAFPLPPAGQSSRGVPQNWFPALGASLVGLLALHVAGRRDRARGMLPPIALIPFALVCLAMSADHGANHQFSILLSTPDPTSGGVANAVVAIPVLVAGALAVFAGRTVTERLAFAAWVCVVLAAHPAGSPPTIIAAFAAYALAVPALLSMLATESPARVPATSRAGRRQDRATSA